MNKKIEFITIIIVIFVFLFALTSKYSMADDSISRILNAHAYELQIIEYDGKGEAKEVSEPILVYHPDLFKDIIEYNIGSTGALPSDHDDMYKRSYGNSYIDPASNYIKGNSGYTSVYGCRETSCTSRTDAGGNQEINQDINKDDNGRAYYWYKACGGTYGDVHADTTSEGQTCFDEYLYNWKTKEKKVSFYGKDVDTSKYYAIYEDDNLTDSRILNGNYLNDLVASFTSSKEVIYEKFGFNIRSNDIDKYYVQVKPVVRVLEYDESKYTFLGSYVIKQITKEKKVVKWDKDSRKNEAMAIPDGEQNGGKTTYTYHWVEETGDPIYGSQCVQRDGKLQKLNITNADSDGSCPQYWFSLSQNGVPKCGRYASCDSGDIVGYNVKYYLPQITERGEKFHDIFHGFKYKSPSYLMTAQEADNQNVLKRIGNNCETEDIAKHCILNDARNCSGSYEYYIGPNKDKALVGPNSSYNYSLIGSCSSSDGEQGIKHYYLANMVDCSNVCGNISDKTSDNFLACAENYCEARVDYDTETRKNSVKQKRNCVLTCGYTYGKGGKGESVNSCNNANPYAGLDKIVNGGSSSCNRYIANNSLMPNIKAVTTSCNGDYVNDFDGNDGNDKIYDQRTYINSACKETTNFNYSDTSNNSLIAGEGLEYNVVQNGEKECTTFFNLEQWKFDFAIAPARDPIRRNRLLYIIDVFNNLLNNNYNGASSANYVRGLGSDDDFVLQEYGKVNLDGNVNYSSNKASVTTVVNEIVDNEKQSSGTIELVGTNEIKDSPIHSTISHESVRKISFTDINNINLNRYLSKSTIEKVYSFDSKCISTDGKASIYNPDGMNVCYRSKVGDREILQYGQNKYYTNFYATANDKFDTTKLGLNPNHTITTTVNLGRETKNSNVYYSNTDVCTYKINDKNDLSCVIDIDYTDAEALGNDLYEGKEVTAILRYNEKLGVNDEVTQTSITVNGTTTSTETKSIKNVNNNSVQLYNIVGNVTTKNGITIQCSKKISLLTPTSCGVGCNLNPVNDKLYTITGFGNVSKYYSFTSNAMDASIEEILTKNKKYSFTNSVIESIADNRRYIKLTNNIQEEVLFGYVLDSSENCNNYCRTSIKMQNNCKKLYKPADMEGIYEYCSVNFNSDVNNYESQKDCVERCSASKCPNDKRNLTVVNSYCENYKELGYKEKAFCVNSCYYEPSSNGEYIFRSIDVTDPFPDSEEQDGKRVIGQNWIGLSNYITRDSQDKSTITGDNANLNVEYVIDLSPTDIRKIRSDTNNGGRKSFTELVYTTDSKKSVVQAYKSKFIRQDFNELFKEGHGNKMAVYNPNTYR